jgi:hypothetical protein
MGEWVPGEAHMTRKHSIELIREGDFIAEVEIEVTANDSDWGPCLSVSDVQKLETVRDALRRGDVGAASRIARVFVLTPIAV